MQEQAKQMPKKKANIFYFVEFGRLRRVLMQPGTEKLRTLQFEIVNRDFEYLSKISTFVSGLVAFLGFKVTYKQTHHMKSTLVRYLNKVYLLPILGGMATFLVSMEMSAMLIGERMSEGIKYVVNDPIYAKWLYPEKKFTSNKYDVPFVYRPISKEWFLSSIESKHMKEALIAFEEQMNRSPGEPDNDSNEEEEIMETKQHQVDASNILQQNDSNQKQNSSQQNSNKKEMVNNNKSDNSRPEEWSGFERHDREDTRANDDEQGRASEFLHSRTESLKNKYLV